MRHILQEVEHAERLLCSCIQKHNRVGCFCSHSCHDRITPDREGSHYANETNLARTASIFSHPPLLIVITLPTSVLATLARLSPYHGVLHLAMLCKSARHGGLSQPDIIAPITTCCLCYDCRPKYPSNEASLESYSLTFRPDSLST